MRLRIRDRRRYHRDVFLLKDRRLGWLARAFARAAERSGPPDPPALPVPGVQ